MESFFDFFSFKDPNIRYVVFGAVMLMTSSAVVGCFTLLRKRALVGDAIAHSVLPGVCLAFLFWGEKNPLVLLIGAFITGFLSVSVMEVIVKKSRIKEDTALGLVLSVFFGLGILLLTYIQHSGNAQQSGLDSFLFGKITSLASADLIVFTILAGLVSILVYLFFKEFTLLSFDENYAISIGLPVKFLKGLLTSLTVFAVVAGIQAVGVVLMAAMLITPAAAARFWTQNIRIMIFLAALFASVSGVLGAYVSYLDHNMPTGPWIVLIISIFAFMSFLFAPKKGVVSKYFQQYRNRKQILEENILKTFYHLGEKSGNFFTGYSTSEIIKKRTIERNRLLKGLSSLKNDGYIIKSGNDWKLTQEGKEKGQRITRTHRLWELYLTQYLNIAPDHVHEDAETIEHILTPELEKRIEEILAKPEQDPHDSKIPYKES